MTQKKGINSVKQTVTKTPARILRIRRVLLPIADSDLRRSSTSSPTDPHQDLCGDARG